jgi:hypothetical protein
MIGLAIAAPAFALFVLARISWRRVRSGQSEFAGDEGALRTIHNPIWALIARVFICATARDGC